MNEKINIIIRIKKENTILKEENNKLNQTKLEKFNMISTFDEIDRLFNEIIEKENIKKCSIFYSILVELILAFVIFVFLYFKLNTVKNPILNFTIMSTCFGMFFCTTELIKNMKIQKQKIQKLKKQALKELEKVKNCDKTYEQLIEEITKLNKKIEENKRIICANNQKIQNLKNEICSQYIKSDINIQTLKEKVKVKKLKN